MKLNPIRCSVYKLTACVLVVLASGSLTWAQLPVAQLRSLFPPGGQAGQTIKVEVTQGSDLDETKTILFNHPGIQLQDKLDPLTNPKQFNIKIAEDVPPGYYSFRVQGRFGVSNPRMFRVDAYPVKIVTEADFKKQSPLSCDVNTVVYSRAEVRNDIDEFVFNLESNKRYELNVESLSLDSLMVPVFEIYQPNGRRVAYRRQIERDDPRLIFIAEQAGDYRIKVYDFLYRGAVGYNYRLSLTDQITPNSINPPMLRNVEEQLVKGLNQQVDFSKSSGVVDDILVTNVKLKPYFPQNTMAISGYISPRQAMSPFLFSRTPTLNRNDTVQTISFSKHPVIAEQEPNNSNEKSQPLTVPCEVYGRFLETNDVDVYSFEAKKNESVW